MTAPAIAMALFAVLAGGFAWALVPQTASRTIRVFVTVGVVAISGSAFFVSGFLMGLPRPAPLAMVALFEDVELSAHQLDEPNAIYIWTTERPPIAWSLPWNTETARRLHEGAQKAGQQGRGLVMRRGFAGEMEFHPAPVQEPPPKG
jgi:hypothetical protein